MQSGSLTRRAALGGGGVELSMLRAAGHFPATGAECAGEEGSQLLGCTGLHVGAFDLRLLGTSASSGAWATVRAGVPSARPGQAG